MNNRMTTTNFIETIQTYHSRCELDHLSFQNFRGLSAIVGEDDKPFEFAQMDGRQEMIARNVAIPTESVVGSRYLAVAPLQHGSR